MITNYETVISKIHILKNNIYRNGIGATILFYGATIIILYCTVSTCSPVIEHTHTHTHTHPDMHSSSSSPSFPCSLLLPSSTSSSSFPSTPSSSFSFSLSSSPYSNTWIYLPTHTLYCIGRHANARTDMYTHTHTHAHTHSLSLTHTHHYLQTHYLITQYLHTVA